MKRLRRNIFNGFTMLSLVLCVGMAALWVRSYGPQDRLGFHKYRAYSIAFVRGQIWLEMNTAVSGPIFSDDPKDERRTPYSDHWESQKDRGFHAPLAWLIRGRWFGTERFCHGASLWWWGTDVTYCVLPCWAFAAIATVAPLGRAASYYRRCRKVKGGLCAVCSYDLRATPERCPECGAIANGAQNVVVRLE